MVTTVASAMTNPQPIDVDEEDDASIDEEQLEEYREMVEQLGSFPDKVKINSLSMVAEDHADTKASAKAIYNIIRERIMHCHKDNLLPLVYVLDSILKNVKGKFIEVIKVDVINWMSVVYRQLPKEQQAKLQKMWRTWNEFKIFDATSWKAMGECFDDQKTGASTVAGITRTNNGALLLSTSLRREMQSVLDDVQSDMENELDKVSLERLAEINPDLLEQIKTAAQASLPVASGVSTDTQQQQQEQQQQQQLPHFFTETRSPETLAQSKAWGEVKWDYLEETHAVITNLQYQVRKSASVEALYTQHEAIEMTQYLAAASATATLLTASLERIKEQQDRKDSKPNVAFPGSDGAVGTNRGFVIDKSKFSNDGIKRKDPAVIGLLYEVGLPFVSSADGRRFASQLELSNHLDALFKKNQIEKSMASTEERGWYNTDPVWTRQAKEEETENADDTPAISALAEEGESDSGTVPADETRDRCVICGINFKMFFDNDNGIYMYSNCREIEVLNDDAAEKESEECLVHVTCWKGLGSPEVLTTDQTLQDTLPHY